MSLNRLELGRDNAFLNRLSYVQFVSGAPTRDRSYRRLFIALASYRPTTPQQHRVLYPCVLVPQALHRAFAMNATHDFHVC